VLGLPDQTRACLFAMAGVLTRTEEIAIPAASGLVNQSIVDANLRQRFGVIVVGIQREDRRMEFNPAPDATIRAGDKLVVLGRPDSLKQLEVEAAEDGMVIEV